VYKNIAVISITWGMHIVNLRLHCCYIASFKSWGGDISRSPMIANAILDRVLHHAKVINIVRDSYRL